MSTTITGTIYTNPSGLGEGWDDRNAADSAFADALAGHFSALGWDITVKRGEGDAHIEGADEREVAHHIGRVFEAFCANDGDADATLAALGHSATERGFVVTYKTSSDHDESTRNTIAHLNDEGGESTLDEVVANCRDLGCDADLFDAAGFRRGYVHADGTYSLS